SPLTSRSRASLYSNSRVISSSSSDRYASRLSMLYNLTGRSTNRQLLPHTDLQEVALSVEVEGGVETRVPDHGAGGALLISVGHADLETGVVSWPDAMLDVDARTLEDVEELFL